MWIPAVGRQWLVRGPQRAGHRGSVADRGLGSGTYTGQMMIGILLLVAECEVSLKAERAEAKRELIRKRRFAGRRSTARRWRGWPGSRGVATDDLSDAGGSEMNASNARDGRPDGCGGGE